MLQNVSIGNILTMLALCGGLIGVYTSNAADNADTKRRVADIEKRAVEDKNEGKEDRKEMKQDIKDTKQNVDLILRKLDVMEAMQRRDRKER